MTADKGVKSDKETFFTNLRIWDASCYILILSTVKTPALNYLTTLKSHNVILLFFLPINTANNDDDTIREQIMGDSLWWLSIKELNLWLFGLIHFMCCLAVMACTPSLPAWQDTELWLEAKCGCYFWRQKVSATFKPLLWKKVNVEADKNTTKFHFFQVIIMKLIN